MSTIADVLSGRAQWVCLAADCSEVLPLLPDGAVGHTITDPPFSAYVHNLQRRVMPGPHRQFARQRGGAGKDLLYHGNPIVKDLGFSHLTAELRRVVAVHAARVTRRWIIVKADMEGVGPWRDDLIAAGAKWIRFGVWWKENAQPQLSGDRPGQGTEGLAIAHSAGGRCRWNSGGKHGRWMHPVATDRNNTGERIHTTQTPVSLWLEILEDFSNPGEIVLDPFMGSGSLGVACLRAKGGPRRYIGMDNGKDANGVPWAVHARMALEAEGRGSTRSAATAGQYALFAGGR